MNLHTLKQTVIPSGIAPRRVRFGEWSGLRFNMDLSNDLGRYAGLYEREVAPFMRRACRGVRTAIDVGASDGWYTLYFLQKTRADRVYTFEPQWAESLLPNILLNRPFNERRLLLSREWVSNSLESVAQWTKTEAPEWIALDSLEISYPCVTKIDIDGGELDALRGATKLMHPGHSHWIIETHSLELEKECNDLLRRWGYEPRIISNAWWRRIVGDQRPLIHNRWLYAH